jgi:hypothetical protein
MTETRILRSPWALLGDIEVTEPSTGAVPLKGFPRWAVGIIGFISLAAAASIVILREDQLPDLLLAALAIFGLAGTAIAAIGRLPSGFQFAGMKLDFTVDTLSDLILTIEGLEEVEDDAKIQITGLIERATRSDVFDTAKRQNESVKDAIATPEDKTPEITTDEPLEVRVRKSLQAVATGQIAEDQEVIESGQGKKPKFKFMFTGTGLRGAEITAICHIEKYSNPTSVDLLRRRLIRALRPATPVSGGIIIVPRGGRDAVRDSLGAVENVLLLNPEDFDGRGKAEERIRRFLEGLRPKQPDGD